MSEQRVPAPQPHDDLDSLSEDDRIWLAERPVEYKDLLEFLRAD